MHLLTFIDLLSTNCDNPTITFTFPILLPLHRLYNTNDPALHKTAGESGHMGDNKDVHYHLPIFGGEYESNSLK